MARPAGTIPTARPMLGRHPECDPIRGGSHRPPPKRSTRSTQMAQSLRIANPAISNRERASRRPVRIVNLDAEVPQDRRIFGRQREYATREEFVAQLQQQELLRTF